MNSNVSFNFTELTPSFGAKIEGVDLRGPLDSDLIDAIKESLWKYHILLFPTAGLTEQQQIDFSMQFGELEKFPAHPVMNPNYPEIYPVSNIESRGFGDIGLYWHADGSFRPRPTVLSFFYMEQAPLIGGETCYTSTVHAFSALPEEIQHEMMELKTVHGNGTVHRLVRTHPNTGTKALFVNLGMMVAIVDTRGEIVGVSPKRNRILLELIQDTLDREGTYYTHHWKDGDLIIADNRLAAHKAKRAPAEYPRLLRRTTTKGELREA